MPRSSSSPSLSTRKSFPDAFVRLVPCLLVVLASKIASAQEGSSTSCMDKGASSCMECLTDENVIGSSTCGWAPGFGCLDSCNIIADISCFEAGNSPDLTRGPDVVCAMADESIADDELCSSKTDCGSCVSTVRANGVDTCHWFGSELGMDASSAHCGPDPCTMLGCGSAVCDAATATEPEDSNDNTVAVEDDIQEASGSAAEPTVPAENTLSEANSGLASPSAPSSLETTGRLLMAATWCLQLLLVLVA
uniref:Uncharacterized protein n=1 Tax=Pseudo-nitzschia multistriata TaxID=183589 RepID=A0A448Z0W5_9STRA